MKLCFLSLLLIATLSACKKCPDCGQNQFCNNNVCQCMPWYEGSPCVPMALKFTGRYIGTKYTNGSNPRPDTFSFGWHSKNPKLVYINSDSFSSIKFDHFWYNKLAQLNLTNSTEAICEVIGGGTGGDAPVNCGTATVSKDGKNLVLTFSPLTSAPFTNAYPDPDTIFTFIGVKQ